MSTAARIDELRKKFEDNPRRFFAPLANELRKAGDLSQAIALCREHLPKQPGHMSGYIVFGQALYEMGELDEARSVFEQALALDPENLIALRHLGDIARRQDQPQVARRWYERVLEADPRNDDIAAHLASLATPTPSVAAIPAPAAFTPIDLAAIPTPVTAAPAVPTPVVAAVAVPTPVSAAPAVPTPITASPAIPTPITASPAIPTPIMASPTVPTPIGQAAFAPIDLDSMVAEALDAAPVVVPTPVVSFPAILPAMPTPDSAMRAVEAESDPFHFAPAEPDASTSALDDEYKAELAAELEAQAAQAEAEAASAFEEGLVAPEWPDTADLLARRETPRSVTPLSVPVTPDAALAFGLEAGDALNVPLPEPEPEVEADMALVTESARMFDPPDSLSGLPLMDPMGEGEGAGVAASTGDRGNESATQEAEAHTGVLAEPAADVETETATLEAVSAEASFASLNDELPGEPSEPSPAFVTETMGELLVAQGFVDRAVTVYEELVRRRPHDPVLAARLQELQDVQQRTSAEVAAREDHAEESTGTFDVADVAGVDTAPPDVEPVAVFTARERFASLAARRVSRRTPAYSTPAYSTPVFSPPLRSTPAASRAAYATPVRTPAVDAAHSDSLASLFGDEAPAAASPQDEAAARQLASAFDPDSPDVGSLSDSFFAGAAGHREPTPTFGTVRQPTPIRGVTAAPPSAAANPAVPQSPAAGATGEFSFDRFFPDPARQPPAVGGAGATAASGPAPSTPPAADDLAQFSAWLKGLGNS